MEGSLPALRHWGQHPGSQRHLLAAQGTAAVAEASFREDESGFFRLPWHPEMTGQGGSSELGLLLKVLPGGGSWEGSYGPEEGSVAGGL